MFAKHGWATAVVAHDASDPLPTADALILDTDSRLDPPEKAYAKVHAATQRLRALGCTWLHKKTCSVFRGNIGAEFDAMLDASGDEFVVVSVAYPKNGRRTHGGIHTVNGDRLEASAFVRDPVHPTRESSLVTVLQAQTKRKVGLVELATVRAGALALRTALAEQRQECNYCIVDATEQSDLTTLAEATHDWRLHAGSSALMEELPRFWRRPTPRHLLGGMDSSDRAGTLVISGSLTPQTRAQTAALANSGTPAVALDTRTLFAPVARICELRQSIDAALTHLRDGRDVLVLADQSDEVVAETKRLGAQHGLDSLTTSKAVSAALAEVAHELLAATGLKRLVVAGGDTSGTVCRRLGIRGNWVLHEIAPGVPSGLAIGRPLLLVLKSGSFGGNNFLIEAVTHLKNLRAPAEPVQP
jgi:uncharacterized protein YgbK (DUF1537 family)